MSMATKSMCAKNVLVNLYPKPVTDTYVNTQEGQPSVHVPEMW